MKFSSALKQSFVICLLLFCTTSALAMEPIPGESGFSGFIRPGAGYLEMESNMMAAEFFGKDLTKDTINSLTTNPEEESSGIFSLPFMVGYTFNNLTTQAFFGTEFSSLSQFDFSQQLGIKQKIGALGILQAGFLFSGISAEVWTDPYVTNRPRTRTDRDSHGRQFAWGKIMGFDLDFTYTYRNIDIDNEASGVFQGLSSANRALLDRDGDQHSFDISYSLKFDQNELTSAFTYQADDRDGKARKNDQYTFQLTYAFKDDPISFNINGVIGWADYDSANPVIGFNNETQKDDIYACGATVYYRNPWGWQLWSGKPISFFAEAMWFQRDANIDFYDEQATVAQIGALLIW